MTLWKKLALYLKKKLLFGYNIIIIINKIFCQLFICITYLKKILPSVFYKHLLNFLQKWYLYNILYYLMLVEKSVLGCCQFEVNSYFLTWVIDVKKITNEAYV